MSNIRLSCIIPSYKDPYLVRTIDSLLLNSELGDGLEIVVCLDGYWPSFELRGDPRVRYIHLGKNRGMRGAINAGVSISRGEFIMRTDEHCIFAKGYDRILTETCKDNWIVTPRRYFLDPIRWELMDIPPVDCERLVIQDCGNGVRKFAGQRWDSRAKKLIDDPIIENQAMQGSMWIVSHKWWNDVIGELKTEGYGPTYQDSVEICMKTWQSGGKLMTNKNTWYAHKHRDFPRTHNEGSPENPSKREESWAYALKVWEPYYRKVLLPKWAERFCQNGRNDHYKRS